MNGAVDAAGLELHRQMAFWASRRSGRAISRRLPRTHDAGRERLWFSPHCLAPVTPQGVLGL